MNNEEQAEHMYSHSATTPPRLRRPSTTQYPLLAPPSTTRRLRCRIASYKDFVDVGADGDDEETPVATVTRRKHGLRIETKMTQVRHLSPQTYKPASTLSTHIPSPYPLNVKRYPDGHPNAAWNPRKRSCGSIESLEFLNSYNRKKQKNESTEKSILSLRVKITRLHPRGKAEDGGSVSPTKLYSQNRQSSRMLNSTCRSCTEAHDESQSQAPKKRKRVVDSTYRDISDTITSLAATTTAPNRSTKKRRKIANPAYRASSSIPTSSCDDLLSALKTTKHKNGTDAKGEDLAVSTVRSEHKPSKLRKRRKALT